MKNVFVGVVIYFLFVTFSAQAAIQIQTKVDPVSDHKWIKPQILVMNTGTAFDLKNMSINYYFYDANLPLNILSTQIFYSSLGSNGITFYFSASPENVTGANGKKANLQCQVRFSQSLILPANTNFEFKFGFHANDWRVFNENDDWSYTTQTSYVQTDAITLIAADGTVLAGTVPGTPTIATAAKVTLNTATYTSATLSVLGADDNGEQNLTYTWATIGTPPAKVTYGDNGTNAAKNTKVTFRKAGTYSFQVTVKDQGNQTAISSTALAIYTVTKNLVVSPPCAIVNFLGSKQFTAKEYDEFGNLVNENPSVNWSISPAGDVTVPNGLVSSSLSSSANVYTTYTVTATDAADNTLVGTASFVVADSLKLIQKAKEHIKHVIVIMQENRSFDNYFGKYQPRKYIFDKNVGPQDQQIDTIPSGITFDDGNGKTMSPAHSLKILQEGGDHFWGAAKICLGFAENDRTSMYLKPENFIAASKNVTDPVPTAVDLMGYHTIDEIPSYYRLADNFVLQDHMFEPVPSWSHPSHLYLFSCWSANKQGVTDIDMPPMNYKYGWNSLANLIDQHFPNSVPNWAVWQGVGWSWNPMPPPGQPYEFCGSFANPDDPNYSGNKKITTTFWNPLQFFKDVTTAKSDQFPLYNNSYGNYSVWKFFDRLSANGADNLPAVSWIVPDDNVSEHSRVKYPLTDGHAYVITIIQKIMANTDLWKSCAIFLAWDDWGGLYDHVRPPKPLEDPKGVDPDGNPLSYGIRVPGLFISPWTRNGFVDRQQLSFDSYARFIEDLFCNGDRIALDNGRPSTPRENEPCLGNLLYECDFSNDQDPGYPEKSKIALRCSVTWP